MSAKTELGLRIDVVIEESEALRWGEMVPELCSCSSSSIRESVLSRNNSLPLELLLNIELLRMRRFSFAFGLDKLIVDAPGISKL